MTTPGVGTAIGVAAFAGQVILGFVNREEDIERGRVQEFRVNAADYDTWIESQDGIFRRDGKIFQVGVVIEDEDTEDVGKDFGGQEVSTFRYLFNWGAVYIFTAPAGAESLVKLWSEVDQRILVDFTDPNGQVGQILDDGSILLDNMQIYLGGPNQLPDANFIAEHGLTEIPAYRRWAYISFRNFPGANGIPPTSAAFAQGPVVASFPVDTIPNALRLNSGAFTSDGSRFITADTKGNGNPTDGEVGVLDMAGRSWNLIEPHGTPANRGTGGADTAFSDDAIFWTSDHGVSGGKLNRAIPPAYDSVLQRDGPSGSSTWQAVVSAPAASVNLGVVGTFEECCFCLTNGGTTVYRRTDFDVSGVKLVEIDHDSFIGPSMSGGVSLVRDPSTGDVWFIGNNSAETSIYMAKFDILRQAWTDGTAGDPFGTISFTINDDDNPAQPIGCYLAATGEICILSRNISNGAEIHFFDPIARVRTRRWSIGVDVEPLQYRGIWRAGPDADGHIWLPKAVTDQRDFIELDLINEVLIRTIDLEDWGLDEPLGGDDHAPLYDPSRQALIISDITDDVTHWIYLDRLTVDSGEVTLRDVIERRLPETGRISLGEIDAVAMTDVFPGAYVPDNTTPRQLIEPYGPVFDFKVQEADRADGYRIRFEKRGAASQFTIPFEDLSTRVKGQPWRPPVKTAEVDADKLPIALELGWRGAYRDWEPDQTLEEAPPEVFDGLDVQREDFQNLSLSRAQGQAATERIFWRKHREIKEIIVTVPRKWADLRPGDEGEIEVREDGTSWRVFLVGVKRLRGGPIELRAKTDGASLAAVVNPPADFLGDEGQTVAPQQAVELFVVDESAPRDEYATSVGPAYRAVMAGARGEAFQGTTVYNAPQPAAGYTQYVRIAATQGTEFGTIDADMPGITWNDMYVPDETTIIGVRLQSGGTLTSVTQAQLLADADLNNALIERPDGRWERLAFRDATLQGDGSYHLGWLIRGKRGSENSAIAGHLSGARILLPTAASAKVKSFPIADAGTETYFKAVGVRGTLGGAATVTHSVIAASMFPRSPTRPELTFDDPSAGALHLAFTRRSRVENFPLVLLEEDLNFRVTFYDAAAGPADPAANIIGQWDSINDASLFTLQSTSDPQDFDLTAALAAAMDVGLTTFAQAWQEDATGGPSYVDETTDINDAGADDVAPFPAGAGVDDAFYLGLADKFATARLNVGQAGAGTYSLALEYFNGTIFTALSGVIDGTSGFQTAGENDVTFTLPTDWAKTAVNGSSSLYYVRAKRDSGTVTTDPLITQGWAVNRLLDTYHVRVEQLGAGQASDGQGGVVGFVGEYRAESFTKE